MTIFELVITKNDEGLTLTEMRAKRRMKIAIKAFKLVSDTKLYKIKDNGKNTRNDTRI